MPPQVIPFPQGFQNMVSLLSNLAVAVALVASYFYVIPSTLNPTVWTKPSPLPSLDGVLAPNQVLTNAVSFDFKAAGEKALVAPESMAFHPVTGHIYTGLGDGRVVVLSQTGEFLKNLLFVGGIVADEKKGKTISTTHSVTFVDNKDKMNYCTSEYFAKRLPWNYVMETSCG